jgi:hypothetical protein
MGVLTLYRRHGAGQAHLPRAKTTAADSLRSATETSVGLHQARSLLRAAQLRCLHLKF